MNQDLSSNSSPAVSYAAGRLGDLHWAVCFALLLGAIAIGAYFFYATTSSKPLVWQMCVLGIAWLCSAFFAWQFIQRLGKGEIDFDGVHWYMGERKGTLSVRFDGQSCMLLRFEDDLNKVDWFWVEADYRSHLWQDLRRAVYSPAGSPN